MYDSQDLGLLFSCNDRSLSVNKKLLLSIFNYSSVFISSAESDNVVFLQIDIF